MVYKMRKLNEKMKKWQTDIKIFTLKHHDKIRANAAGHELCGLILPKDIESSAVIQQLCLKSMNSEEIELNFPMSAYARHALLRLVHALVVSKVNYCNSVLAGISHLENSFAGYSLS